MSLEDARRLVTEYVAYYNTVRLHSAIGYVTPRDKLEGREQSIFAERDRKLHIMDDLDGILAKKLGLRSEFGAGLDNVCDAVAHILIAMVVGSHYGGVVLAVSWVSAIAILIRVVQRIAPSPATGTGTPTNEVMRHLLLLIILQEFFGFDITLCLVAAFLLNSASMLVPFAVPFLIRSMAKSATAILGVNVALAVAWCVPGTAPFMAAAFLGTYLYSFVFGGVGWLRRA